MSSKPSTEGAGRELSATPFPTSAMTPQEIVSELDRHIVGQGRRQARRRDRAAQPLAAPAGRRADARRDHAEEHPDDRPDGRRQDRDRAAPGASWPMRRSSRSRRPSSPRSATSARTSTRSSATWSTWRSSRSARTRCARQRSRAEDAAEDRILDILVPGARAEFGIAPSATPDNTARQVMRKRLREGTLDDKEIEIEVADVKPALEIMGPAGMEEMTEQLRGMFANLGAHQAQDAQAAHRRGAQAPRRGGSGQARQRRRGEDPGARQRRAERHRLPRRDRQGDLALGIERQRRRLAPGRAARPAAAGRRHDGQHQVRHGQDRPHPLHRLGRFPPQQAERPDPRAAGPLPDPRRARLARASTTSRRS